MIGETIGHNSIPPHKPMLPRWATVVIALVAIAVAYLVWQIML